MEDLMKSNNEQNGIDLNDSNLFPVLKESEIGVSEYTKIPFSRLAALGTSFQPLTQAVQTAITGTGGSGIYFVNTHGKRCSRRTRQGILSARL